MRRLLRLTFVLGVIAGVLLGRGDALAQRRQDARGNPPYPTPVGPSIKVTSTGTAVRLGYSTGTITVDPTTGLITGSGTAWATAEAAGGIAEGMVIIVGADYRNPLVITEIVGETSIQIHGTPPGHLAGSGLSYVICLAPQVDYVVTALPTEFDLWFLVGDSTVTAKDGQSAYLGKGESWIITPWSNKLFISIITSGASGTSTLVITRCE